MIAPANQSGWRPGRTLTVLAAVVALAAACGDGGAPVSYLSREQLMDPESCRSCHPAHYEEWSGSMHAYAADDPIFIAMNQRVQRGPDSPGRDFCLNCHAPLAVRAGLTQNGTDAAALAALPRAMKGVTCYYCHATVSVDGTHNNPLQIATDDNLYGPFDDAVAGTPHRSTYSRFLDSTTVESAAACGSCHDIQTVRGAHVERTFAEWRETVFAVPPNGASCASCHMPGRDGPAAATTSRTRRVHSHAFPAVDLALAPFPAENPQNDKQRRLAQALLDTVFQATLCLDVLGGRVELTLDNVSAGHHWPSGATPDRRAWIELEAFSGGASIYASGGPAARPLEHSTDPDLWLIRDCIYDDAGNERVMFWEAAQLRENGIPGSVILDINDPTSFTRTHVKKTYPDAARDVRLPGTPDRITAKIHLQSVGDDVLDDLVASGDLDPALPPLVARYELGGGATLEWTPAKATARVDPQSGATLSCVGTGTWRANTSAAVSHAHCPDVRRASGL